MLLTVKDLVVQYGKIKALKGVSLEVEHGRITAILGANGAGKSTLLKTISGLIRPAEGEIRFEGRLLDKLDAGQIVEMGIAQCPEGRKVFPRQTVYENLRLGAHTRKDRVNVEKDIKEMFARFPSLAKRRDHKAGFLSGGEQQMLVFARALMSRPKLVLLDEPSMGLAPVLVDQVFDWVKEIKSMGITVLLVEQNAMSALEIADHAYILEVGRIVASDAASVLLASERVRESYLGGDIAELSH